MRLSVLRPVHPPDAPMRGTDAEPWPGRAPALRRQLPVFYLIIASDVGAVVFMHLAAATLPPVWGTTLLIVAGLAVLLPLCLFRLRYWLRPAGRIADDSGARREAALVWFTSLIWMLGLFAVDDRDRQCQAVFFVDVNVVAGMFLLTQLRGVAVLIAGLGALPLTVFLVLGRNPALGGLMGIDTLLVCAVLVIVARRSHDDDDAIMAGQRELTARQRETQRLCDENLRLASIDSLSGLPNRRKFFLELDSRLKDAQAAGTRFAVAVLDLDRFRMINDLHGHTAGDRLLAQVAARLKPLTGETVLLARLGGDEFGAIVVGEGADAGIAIFGAQVRAALEDPILVGDKLSAISFTIGGVIHPDAGDTAEELFERADYALFHAKRNARGGLVLFSAEFETGIRHAGLLEETLRAADFESEFSLVFQPMVDISKGRIVAFEALARWVSPTLGRIPPNEFIAVAERTQTINRLTIVLLAKALDAARFWPADISLSFNLSAHDLINHDTMETIRKLVGRQLVAPSRIEFEVTETGLLTDFDRAAKALHALHDSGVRVSLDDFGTGFSSLGYVHRLPLDKIKIDRSFVADVDASRTAPSIIKTIIDLCRNLGFSCVVEGVETESQLLILKGLGCRLIQGYHFSRPVDEAAALELIERFNVAIDNVNEAPSAMKVPS